jgi:hypothetical protein
LNPPGRKYSRVRATTLVRASAERQSIPRAANDVGAPLPMMK